MLWGGWRFLRLGRGRGRIWGGFEGGCFGNVLGIEGLGGGRRGGGGGFGGGCGE